MSKPYLILIWIFLICFLAVESLNPKFNFQLALLGYPLWMGGGLLTWILLAVVDLRLLSIRVPVRAIAFFWAVFLLLDLVPADCRQEIAVSAVCPAYLQVRSPILKLIFLAAAIESRSRTAVGICAIVSSLPIKIFGGAIVIWESYLRVSQGYGFFTDRLVKQWQWGFDYWVVNGVVGLNQVFENSLSTIKLHSVWFDLLLGGGILAPFLFAVIVFSKSKTLIWYCWILVLTFWSCNWWWISWLSLLHNDSKAFAVFKPVNPRDLVK